MANGSARGRFRSALEIGRAENAAIHGRKGAKMSVLGSSFPPATGTARGWIPAADRSKPVVATGSKDPKKIAQTQFKSPYIYGLLNCVWAIITYMSHTFAIGRIFNAYLFRDHAHIRVHFGRRPESAAIVSFVTRIF